MPSQRGRSDAQPLDEPVRVLLGGRTASLLGSAFGIETAGDLLRHLPRRYLERGELTNLQSLAVGEFVSFVARIEKVTTRPMKKKKGTITIVVVTDGTARMEATFFNQRSWFTNKMQPGRHVYLSGTVSVHGGHLTLTHPQWDLLDEDTAEQAADGAGEVDLQEWAASLPVARASPYVRIYPASSKVNTRAMATAVTTVLDTLTQLPDPVPAQVRARAQVPGLLEAFRLVHHPQAARDPDTAMRRFAFEEAFVLQTELARRRRAVDELGAQPRPRRSGGLLDAFDARLPFELTRGQVDVGEVLFTELARPHPMRRLLQGEVGSGKTVVALRAMLAVVDAGGQAALLAPTEVLAAQHARSLAALLGPLGRAGELDSDDRATRVTLLTGSLGAAARRRTLLEAAAGEAGIVIGTHALLEDRVQFADLGLVVVDEQHRFGVEQRSALAAKVGSGTPHVLVMTATPIPRTIAMTVFGDLEVSTLREIPAGRSSVQTSVVPVATHPGWLDRAWSRIAEEVAAGRQAYVVCPRIGDEAAGSSDPVDDSPEAPEPTTVAGTGAADGEPVPTTALLELLPRLRAHPLLAGLRVEALHGRLPAEEKDTVVRSYADGAIDVLVATTVIEVGVDVPNASVMVIMDADRFGVSSLHQLRGRIGRGAHPGLCLLVTALPDDAPAAERLQAVAATTDGFELSEIDLTFRREGDVLGAAQSGSRTSLEHVSVLRDVELITAARAEAGRLVDADPDLLDHPELARACARLEESGTPEYLDKS